MSRSSAREKVFKLIFEYTFSLEEDDGLLEEYISECKDEADYISEVYHGVLSKYNELCSFIAEKSQGFKFDRIYKVDLAILLLALYEIKYIDSIPVKVSVNEALNLSKVYSTESSYKFINGILSSMVK